MEEICRQIICGIGVLSGIAVLSLLVCAIEAFITRYDGFYHDPDDDWDDDY
jgi:hypothetical protein